MKLINCVLTFVAVVASKPHIGHGDEPLPSLTDEKKLEIILRGKQEFTRSYRMKSFQSEGEISAIGRLVTIGDKVYFKTVDQSYIDEDKKFPYPELFFELHLSQSYAYQPLLDEQIINKRSVVYDGPIQIVGNWAYERPYHIFGVVWVDAVKKVKQGEDADWSEWLQRRKEGERAIR